MHDPDGGTYVVITGGQEHFSVSGLRARGLILLAHYHPMQASPHPHGVDPAGRIQQGDQFASIEDVANLAEITYRDERRVEWVDFQLEDGEWGHCRFEVDKTGGRIAGSVEIVHGGDVIESHTFDSLEAYDLLLGRRFGVSRPIPEGTNVLGPTRAEATPEERRRRGG